jgi:two-component system cell cycle response regulator PopA
LRIVVRAHDARRARDAQAQLAAAGVEASAFAGDYRPAPDGEDILLAPAADLKSAMHLVNAALAHERPPIATLAGLSMVTPFPSGAAGVRPFSGAVALDAPPNLLRAQVEAWLRVATAEDERVRRVATATDLGAALPAKQEPRTLKALYIGAPNAMFLALEHALADHGGVVAAAFSSYAGFDHLHDEPFDAVVLNGAQDSATALSLCSALRRNASLYHLPTMVVTANDDANTAAAAIERGASAVAAANEPCGPSLGWLFEAVRRERRRRVAEHDIRALRDVMGEARTGLFKHAAFEAHLTRLAVDHHFNGRPLALAALRVLPAHGARQPSEQVWKRGFDEIASLAARLMRECDTGAAIGADFIALAMPATQLAGAKRTALRIAAVAECTAFASGEGGAGPLVFEQSAVELQPGESGAGMLARALRALDAESIPA